MSDPEKELGKAGEERAALYLKRQCGYRILQRNYRTRLGEIDIIARDCDTIVFVEVKTRRSLCYGYPAEAVAQHKQFKLKITAQSYMSRYRLWDVPCRFDVIEVMPGPGGALRLHHIRHAFWPGM